MMLSVNIAGLVPSLGSIDQISYAVRDLAAAMPRFEMLFGPFRTMQLHVEDLIYRGRPAEAVIDVAFGRSGHLEIELVAPVSGQFAQREFLDKYGEGLHHVRFTVDDIERQTEALCEIGFSVVMRGRSQRAHYAYFEHPEMIGDSLVELVQWVGQ